MLAVFRSRKNSKTIKIFMLRDNLRTGVCLARISAYVNSIYRQSIKIIKQSHGKTKKNTYQQHLQKPRLLQ